MILIKLSNITVLKRPAARLKNYFMNNRWRRRRPIPGEHRPCAPSPRDEPRDTPTSPLACLRYSLAHYHPLGTRVSWGNTKETDFCLLCFFCNPLISLKIGKKLYFRIIVNLRVKTVLSKK